MHSCSKKCTKIVKNGQANAQVAGYQVLAARVGIEPTTK